MIFGDKTLKIRKTPVLGCLSSFFLNEGKFSTYTLLKTSTKYPVSVVKEFYVGFYVVAAMFVSLLLIIDAGQWAAILSAWWWFKVNCIRPGKR